MGAKSVRQRDGSEDELGSAKGQVSSVVLWVRPRAAAAEAADPVPVRR